MKRENFSNFNEYPHRVFASIILVKGRIANYKICNYRWTKTNWYNNKQPRIIYDNEKHVTVKSRSFIVRNSEEHNKAFTVKAKNFFRKYKLVRGYGLIRPY